MPNTPEAAQVQPEADHFPDATKIVAQPAGVVEALRSLLDMDIAYKRGPAVEHAVEDARAALAAADAALSQVAVTLTGEQMHDVLRTTGPDLLELAKQWADNKIHTYSFTHQAERIVAAAVERGRGITGETP